MTRNGGKIPVPVEWAWRGKMPDDRGYRLLGWSTGDISAKNFEEILDRFAPGTLERLPQVTVSYVPGVAGPGYLSMAFHEEAGSLDRLGRDVTFTRFFCVPYRELAAGMVSYSAMYEAFELVRLQGAPAAPFRAELSGSAAAIPGDAARALPVTELLLTGNPVCIVGAESTTMAERLSYIDTVMSLLPYGLRAEMTAATWTSSTYRGHKFRLFFSEAPRRTDELGVDDHVVRWPPDMTNITRAANTRVPAIYGDEYRQWLQLQLEPSITADLAEETKARAFKTVDVDEMLEIILDKQKKRFFTRSSKRREIAVKNDEIPARPDLSPEPKHAKNASQDKIEVLIDGIAEILNSPAGDARSIGRHLDGLREELGYSGPLSGESRERYRVRIAKHNLLRDSIQIARDKKVGCYKVLLRAAFGEEISYLDYCRIEEMLHDQVPDKPLLQAIDEIFGANHYVDLRALFIVRYHLRKGKLPKSDFQSNQLVELAADRQLRPDHAGLLWDGMIAAIRDARTDEIERVIVPLLRDRGFLALDLQERAPADLKYQVDALTVLLMTVYSGPVGRNVFLDILMGARQRYPTLALLLAVCRMTAEEDVDFLLNTFMWGLARSDEVPEEARYQLARLGWSALNNQLEQTAVVPSRAQLTQAEIALTQAVVPSTQLEVLGLPADAVQYMDTVHPSDLPKEKRGRVRRFLVWGDFPVNDEKSRGSDDR